MIALESLCGFIHFKIHFMEKKLFFYLTVLALLLSTPSIAQKTNKLSREHTFFTSSDQTCWTYVIKDKKIPVSEVFKMDKGVLLITGVSSGYLRTKKKYSNYELYTEWRWLKTPGNSGVLVHIQGKDSIWPVCYQVQQKAGDAGDIICMNGLWAKECADSVKFTIKKMQSSNEKPLGEWNTMKIICRDKTLQVFVNGILQNSVSGLTATNGYIGFQNEGKPLEFRTLRIINFKNKK